MSAPREYWVGLPVGVRVHQDGRVTWIVDTSEATRAMSEEFSEADEETNPAVAAITEEQMLLDCAIVDAVSATPQVDTAPDQEMKCPVRYACGFRTGNLGDMAAHILDTEADHGA